MNSPFFNKGSGFPQDERKAFGIEGLLPAAVHTLDQQVARAWGQLCKRNDSLAKNTFLQSLKSQNLVSWELVVMGIDRYMREREKVTNFGEIIRCCIIRLAKNAPKCLMRQGLVLDGIGLTLWVLLGYMCSWWKSI